MRISSFFKNPLVIYFAKFIGAFCILYFGTKGIIGLSAPVGYYSPFVAHYLNFIPAFRYSLLYGAKFIVYIFGYDTYIPLATQIRVVGGSAVNLVYSCLGYGITSFWLAFVFANRGAWKYKLLWMIGGTIVLWLINVIRISLVLLANTKNWKFPFGLDNHSWFNIVAYIAIFVLIYSYDRASKKRALKVSGQKSTL